MGEAELMQMAMARFAAFVAVVLMLVKYIGLTYRAVTHPRGGWIPALRFLIRNGEVVFLVGLAAYYWGLMFATEKLSWPRYLPTVDNLITVNVTLALYFFFLAWPGRRRRFEDWLEG